MKIRRAHERGLTQTEWLTSYHTFSFGEYFDPSLMGFHALRVINEDWVAPGRGFGMHGHRDMEIITVVLEGELEHQDSLGNKGRLGPGEVQVMSAGAGIRHSENNPSGSDRAHFLQIWIEPRALGIKPHYDQRAFPLKGCLNSWFQLAGPQRQSAGAFQICQDVEVFYGAVARQGLVTRELPRAGSWWAHIISGEVMISGVTLHAGDAVAVEKVNRLEIAGMASRSELLVFQF